MFVLFGYIQQAMFDENKVIILTWKKMLQDGMVGFVFWQILSKRGQWKKGKQNANKQLFFPR